MLYQRATDWLSVPHMQRRIALLALLFALPSLWVGLQADDYLLREQVLKGGPFAAYLFTARGEQASHTQVLEQRRLEQVPWWTDSDLLHPSAVRDQPWLRERRRTSPR